MKITLDWLEEQDACRDGINYYKTLGVEDFFEVSKCCLRDDKKSYFDWLLDNGDIRTLDKSDVLAFCGEYGDAYPHVYAELAFRFSQGVSYKEYYVGLLSGLNVKGVKDLTLEEVSSTGRDYWRRLYRDASYMSVEESVYYVLLRIIDADYGEAYAWAYRLDTLSYMLGDARFSYRGQLDFLLKELKV